MYVIQMYGRSFVDDLDGARITLATPTTTEAYLAWVAAAGGGAGGGAGAAAATGGRGGREEGMEQGLLPPAR